MSQISTNENSKKKIENKKIESDTLNNKMFKKSLKDKSLNTIKNKMTHPFNCSKCDKPSYTSTCVSCMRNEIEKDLKEEFQEKKSINNIVMKIEDVFKIKCRKYGKEPFGSVNWTNPKSQSKNYKATADNNVGIVCSKDSGVFAVDLDFYTKKKRDGTLDKFEPDTNEEHGLFYKTFGKEEEFISKFNTFTQKTPNGGIHLLFKHKEGLIQTSSKKYKIDTRGGNTNGYIVGFDSVVAGKKYEVILDTDIKEIPVELESFLKDYIFESVPVSNKQKRVRGRKVLDNMENKKFEVEYSYNIPESKVREVVSKLPSIYFEDFTKYFILTSALKQLNQKGIWEETKKKVDSHHLEQGSSWYLYDDKLWDKVKSRVEKGSYYFEHLAKAADCYELVNECKYKKVPENKVVPDRVIDVEKLGYGLEITSKKDMIIKSDTGTGKTTLFKKYIEKSQSKFISIVSRRTLANEQFEDFLNIADDVNYYEHGSFWSESGSMVICIDSLLKISNWDFSNYTIFLDEFDSIIKYLIKSPTMSAIKTELFDFIVNDIFMNAKCLVMADADISDISMKFIDYIRVLRKERNIDRDFEFVQNKYIHNRGTPAEEYFRKEALITKAKKTDRWLFAVDSKEEAINIYKETHTEEKPVVLIIAEDNVSKDKEMFCKLSQHERVVFSPKIVYGLDSNGYLGVHEREVFCYYKEHTISPSNMLQQINRERKISKLNYMFEKKQFQESEYSLVEDMKEDLFKDNEFALKQFENEDSYLNKMFVDLLVDYEYILDCYQTNKYAHFQTLIKERGFIDKTIEYKPKPVSKVEKKIIKAKVKKNTKEYFLENWNTADALNSRLNEDILKVYNTEDIQGIKELYQEAGETEKYLYTKKLYMDSAEKVERDLNKDKDFSILKVKGGQNKVKFINDISVELGISKNLEVVEQKTITEERASTINKKYRQVFGGRNKKDIELDTEYNKKQFVATLLKNVLGKDILKKKKVRKGKKTETEVSVNQEKIEKMRKIYKLGRRPRIINKALESVPQSVQDIKRETNKLIRRK